MSIPQIAKTLYNRPAAEQDVYKRQEFSLEENIALARQFLLENFVSRGMVVDFAVHQPDREDGGILNPHFHVLCPIRPIEQNGKWGLKQRRVYELDEDGNRIRDQNGEFVFMCGYAFGNIIMKYLRYFM